MTISLMVMEVSFLHALFGCLYPDVPSRTMFRYIDRCDYELHDRSGLPVCIQDNLPARAYWISSGYFVDDVGRWFAQTHPSRAPFSGRHTVGTLDTGTSEEFDAIIQPDGTAEIRIQN